MADAILTTEPRTERGSRPAGRLRRAGRLPAVVYGLGTETRCVSVPARELERALHGESGANTLITLQIDGEEALALARQIQRHPTKGHLVHVDFVRIRRDVAVTAEVPLHPEGEAPGVKGGGILEQTLFSLTVEAKPADIPTALTVDVSGLELGDQIHVRDVAVPPGVTLHHEPDELVVQVAVPRGLGAEEGEAAEGEAAEGEAAEGEAGASASDGGAVEG